MRDVSGFVAGDLSGLERLERGRAMGRAELLQAIREMRFEGLLDRHEGGELGQQEAAGMLGISERTFRRWRDRLRDEGPLGLRDRRIGRGARSCASKRSAGSATTTPSSGALRSCRSRRTRCGRTSCARRCVSTNTRTGGSRSFTARTVSGLTREKNVPNAIAV
jgi:hypothetical protein